MSVIDWIGYSLYNCKQTFHLVFVVHEIFTWKRKYRHFAISTLIRNVARRSILAISLTKFEIRRKREKYEIGINSEKIESKLGREFVIVTNNVRHTVSDFLINSYVGFSSFQIETDCSGTGNTSPKTPPINYATCPAGNYLKVFFQCSVLRWDRDLVRTNWRVLLLQGGQISLRRLHEPSHWTKSWCRKSRNPLGHHLRSLFSQSLS